MDHYAEAENLLKESQKVCPRTGAYIHNDYSVRAEMLTRASIHAMLSVAQRAAPSVINHHHGLLERF